LSGQQGSKTITMTEKPPAAQGAKGEAATESVPAAAPPEAEAEVVAEDSDPDFDDLDGL